MGTVCNWLQQATTTSKAIIISLIVLYVVLFPILVIFKGTDKSKYNVRNWACAGVFMACTITILVLEYYSLNNLSSSVISQVEFAAEISKGLCFLYISIFLIFRIILSVSGDNRIIWLHLINFFVVSFFVIIHMIQFGMLIAQNHK